MTRIELSGEVGDDRFNVPYLRNFLDAAAGAPVELVFDSPGGCTMTSDAIYKMVLDYPGPTVALVHHAASSAVAPMLACRHRVIAATGTIFVHQAWSASVGTGDDIQAVADYLRRADDHTANCYARACDQPVEAIIKLMRECTTITPAEALALGMVHEIQPETGPPDSRCTLPWAENAQFMVRAQLNTRQNNTARWAAFEIAAMPTSTAPALPLLPPQAGRSVRAESDAAETRGRDNQMYQRLLQRLRSFAAGMAPDPRRSPITASWRCDCTAMNFSPPGHNGRPTPCRQCGGSTRSTPRGSTS